jgi:hypothetical protein
LLLPSFFVFRLLLNREALALKLNREASRFSFCEKITLPSPGAKLTSVQWSPEYVATTVSIERATSTDGLLRWTVDGSLDSDGVAPQAAALRPVRMAYQITNQYRQYFSLRTNLSLATSRQYFPNKPAPSTYQTTKVANFVRKLTMTSRLQATRTYILSRSCLEWSIPPLNSLFTYHIESHLSSRYTIQCLFQHPIFTQCNNLNCS